jgi:hypothetical protein
MLAMRWAAPAAWLHSVGHVVSAPRLARLLAEMDARLLHPFQRPGPPPAGFRERTARLICSAAQFVQRVCGADRVRDAASARPPPVRRADLVESSRWGVGAARRRTYEALKQAFYKWMVRRPYVLGRTRH